MDVIIRNEKRVKIIPCECGSYPEFKHLSYSYTDTWLECPKCGKRTKNMGGFHYASEIPMGEAKLSAVKAWNNREFEN